MRLLIYGAGVIGTLYARLLFEAGYDTTIYARGKRLDNLLQNGLRYRKGNKVWKANINIISKLDDNDFYDFIFLAVRENQLHVALKELKSNHSPTIVTMVNSLEEYEIWENICGKGRILPAFPGAGGSFDDDILVASLTPRMIQPTTFSEIDGRTSRRTDQLAAMFKRANIPYQMVNDMHAWQLCHLAMVVPIADAYYEADCPEKVGLERQIMLKTARRIKRNLWVLRKGGVKLLPMKMNLFLYVPVSILSMGLCATFLSNFGNTFMYQHSMKAPDEMRRLHRQFYSYLKDYFIK